jgi:hypothetical protein
LKRIGSTRVQIEAFGCHFDVARPPAYITNNETRSISLASSTWPGVKFSTLTRRSGLPFPKRVRMLPTEMQELYDFFYRQLSWSVHSGSEGSYGINPETFARMCRMAYNLAARDYERVLRQVIQAIKLDKHDPLIDRKMEYARYLPFTEDAEREEQLGRDLGL